MANTLTGTISISGQFTYEKDTDLSSAFESFAIGSNDLDAIAAEFTNGTGNEQATHIWADERTLANGADDSLDLAGGLTDVYGATLTFTKIKAILIDIDSPDGTKFLKVGPNNTSNAFVGPWGANAANVYETVYQTMYKVHPFAGWTVAATTGDLLIISNTSTGSVSCTYRIVLVGLA